MPPYCRDVSELIRSSGSNWPRVPSSDSPLQTRIWKHQQCLRMLLVLGQGQLHTFDTERTDWWSWRCVLKTSRMLESMWFCYLTKARSIHPCCDRLRIRAFAKRSHGIAIRGFSSTAAPGFVGWQDLEGVWRGTQFRTLLMEWSVGQFRRLNNINRTVYEAVLSRNKKVLRANWLQGTDAYDEDTYSDFPNGWMWQIGATRWMCLGRLLAADGR